MQELLGKFPSRFAKKHREYFNARGGIKNMGSIKTIDLRVIMIVECQMEKKLAQELYEFITPILKYNPKLRATAADCLAHPFLLRSDTVSGTAPAAQTTDSAVVGTKHHSKGDEKRHSADVKDRSGVVLLEQKKAE